MRGSRNRGPPTIVPTVAIVLLLSAPITFVNGANSHPYRMSANVNYQNLAVEDEDDDDHEGGNKSSNLFSMRFPSAIDSEIVGRVHHRSMRKMCDNVSAHILHRTKKMKRWNTYHRNRFKRSTTVEHARAHFTDLANVTPNVSIDYVTVGPSTRRTWPDESHLLGVSPQSVFLLEKSERSKRNGSLFGRRLKWPIKRVVKVEGDVIIGGLMMVHSRGADGKLCGQIMPQGGVQALEVMLYTLKEINKRPDMPFKIGAHILDDCDTDTYGLEMALDFIKANLQNLDDNLNKSECSSFVSKPIWGVVGAPSSITSIQVANLLRLFNVPMISPFSTSPELSNKQKFDYFCRTIPSDYYQVQVIAGIIEKLQWTYVSIIYEESNYGMKGLEELEKVLAEKKVCIAVKEKVLKDSGVPTEAFFDEVVEKLMAKNKSVGVIVFASDQEVAGIMSAVKRVNQTKRFSWIGSDGWSARNLVSEGNEEVVEGTVSVQPLANPVKGFEEYFFSRSPYDMINPYFAEYWETVFQCRLPGVPLTPFNLEFKGECDRNARLDPHNVELENQLQFVHQATGSFSNALINMHADLCGRNTSGICERMLQKRGSGVLLKYIKQVNFTDFSGDEFRFNKDGDGPARYNIVHYKQTTPGVYKWVRVGRYESGHLDLNVEQLQFKLDNPAMPASSCSETCKKGEMKKYSDGDKCCWKCLACSKYEVVTPLDETECKECVLGTQPDEDRKACFDVNVIVKRSDLFQYAITGTTVFGFFNVLAVFILYAYNFNSAIVRASSREAQVLVLIGAVILHANAYSFLLDPNEVVCSMQSYLSGLGYILIYGTLFWKSYRIVRIFDLNSQYKNLNSSAFVLLVLGLCCIQKILSVVWTYFADPRKAIYVYPTRDTKMKLCSLFVTIEMGYFVGLIFPLISIILCYFRTKKITNTPKVFDDSPQIFFCIRFTILSWIALCVMHFTTSDTLFRQSVLAIVTNLNGCIIIFALFYRSIFIILFRPRMNTREYLRASRANHTMKSQQVDEFSHTRENYSQCMMNEFSFSADENVITKRDVSIQYSNSLSGGRKSDKATSVRSNDEGVRKVSADDSRRSSASESLSNGTSKSVNVDSNCNTIKSSPYNSEEEVNCDLGFGPESPTTEQVLEIIVKGKQLVDDEIETSWRSVSVERNTSVVPLDNDKIRVTKVEFINKTPTKHNAVNYVQTETPVNKSQTLSDENSFSETTV